MTGPVKDSLGWTRLFRILADLREQTPYPWHVPASIRDLFVGEPRRHG